MRKSTLNPLSVILWADQPREYASMTLRNFRLIFWVIGSKYYKVTHGDHILYEGDNIRDAITVWDNA